MKAEVRCVESLQDAMALVDGFEGSAQALTLSLPDSLFGVVDLGGGQLATGVGAAMLADRALARGWLANGAEVLGDRRLWKFMDL